MNREIEQALHSTADTGQITTHLWFAFGVCFLGNVFSGLMSMLMPVYLPVVVRDLSGTVNADDMNQISAYINAIYLAGWTIGGFTWGFISDKIGRVRSINAALALFGVLTLLIRYAPGWEFVVALRFLSGFVVGGVLVITPTFLSEIWPAKTRSVILGIDSIGFPVGIFLSGAVNYLVSDWRSGLLAGFLPLVLAVVGWMVLQESKEWSSSRRESSQKAKFSPDIRKNLLRGSIIFGSMLIGLWGMFSWIPTWVQSLVSADGQSERGLSMMLLGAGGLAGGFVSGWLSNALGVRRAMLTCFSGCLAMSVLLFGLNAAFSSIIYVELAVLSVFFGISQGLLSIYIPQLFPYHIRGTATGFCFNVGRIVTTASVFFVGVVVTTLGGYGNTLLAFAGIFVAGIITVYFTQDQRQIQLSEDGAHQST
jgi:MFS family permease